MDRRSLLLSLGSAALVSCGHASRLMEAQIEGGPLPYVEAGSGPPMVLVHGGLQDYRYWASLLPIFAQRFRVIAYSRRNHFPGPTSPDSTPDGAADLHAADLANLVARLIGGPANIVAHSAGAHAALFFAVNHPDLVRTLTVNEPPATGLLLDAPGGPDTVQSFNAGLAPARAAFRDGDVDAGLRLFADAVGGPGEFERRSRNAAFVQMMRDNAAAHTTDAMTTRPRPSFTSAMARALSMPVLAASGDRSPGFFRQITDRLAICAPNAQRVTIANSSHGVPAEQPTAFAAAVTDFVGRV